MKNKKNTVQQWLPFEKVSKNGIIKFKDNSYVKILKVSPINFNLKSSLEKESILNAYKIFLKTCNFNIENLSKHISKIEKNNLNKNEKIKIISKKYIEFIQEINQKRKSSSKNFYILIKENPENKKITENVEEIMYEKLNEKYYKIKESLSRCGNIVTQCDTKQEVEKIINSFLNLRKELNII